jgi:hypothetical protein
MIFTGSEMFVPQRRIFSECKIPEFKFPHESVKKVAFDNSYKPSPFIKFTLFVSELSTDPHETFCHVPPAIFKFSNCHGEAGGRWHWTFCVVHLNLNFVGVVDG